MTAAAASSPSSVLVVVPVAGRTVAAHASLSRNSSSASCCSLPSATKRKTVTGLRRAAGEVQDSKGRESVSAGPAPGATGNKSRRRDMLKTGTSDYLPVLSAVLKRKPDLPVLSAAYPLLTIRPLPLWQALS